MWGGFVMEFEIIGDAAEAFADSVAGGHFNPVDTGNSWSMSDVGLVGDVVSLDSALQNSYAEHVLSGKSRPINYGTYITMQQTVTGDNISVNVSRAVSRLKTVFCSFDGDFNPSTAVAYPYYLVKRPFNFFYHPMGKRLSDSEAEDKIGYDFKKELEYQNRC